MVKHFRELRIYRQAFKASSRIFEISKNWPKEERYSLTDQIRRSSRSVFANIAEAWRKRRYEAHFVSKLSDADAEAAETQSWLDAALDCGYLPRKKYDALTKQYDKVIGGLVKMMGNAEQWCGPSKIHEKDVGYDYTDDAQPPLPHPQTPTPPNSHTILDEIVDDTRSVIAERKRERPQRELEQMPAFNHATLDFAEALRGDTLSVIAEIKKASPSKGVIRDNFDVAGIARQYADNGAAALSVLTEPLHFQGKPDYLAVAREAAEDVPLLRKDFIVDPYQLVEARAYGADAVLLIAAVLEKSELRDLHQAADELGLACLVELYDEDEIDKVDFGQIEILGVNNRDLRTFEVDLNHAPRVFERVPSGIVKVGESGLKTADDLAHLHARGIDAVLIGETLMRADRPGEKLRTLREGVAQLVNA